MTAAAGVAERWLRPALLGVFWVLIFLPVYPELVREYLEVADSSHGFLVPLIAGYMAWQQREALERLSPAPWAPGLVLLVLTLGIYLVGLAGGILVLQRSMMVFSLLALVLYLAGREVFRTLAFPLFFLLFLVPLPVSLLSLVTFPLQLMASRVAEIVIRGVGIPVLREGNMLHFVQTQLEVAEACSGIRSIMALLMIGTLFVFFLREGWRSKAVLIVSTVPIAMLANIVRVSGTGILAHFFGGAVARGFLHEFSGMAVFAFGFGLLYLEYRLLRRLALARERTP